jgi:hypothetical protein
MTSSSSPLPPDVSDQEAPARDRPLAGLVSVLRSLPRRTLGKVVTLLLLLAAVIYFRSRTDTVVRLFGPQGGNPTPTGRENQHERRGGGFSEDSVPSSPR